MPDGFNYEDAIAATPAQSPSTGGFAYEDASTPPPQNTSSKEDNAMQAINSPSMGRSVAARLTGYGANAISQIPGLKELGSAEAAAFGAGKGTTFGERYNDLENSQKAMRDTEWKQEQNDDLSIPIPGTDAKIGPSVVGDTGATILGAGLTGDVSGRAAQTVAPKASARVAEWAAEHPYWASTGVGAEQGAVQGFARGDDAASRIAGAVAGAGTGALLGPTLTAVGRNVVAPIAGRVATAARDFLGMEQPEVVPELTKQQKAAQKIVQDALKTEKIDPEEIAANLEQAKKSGLPVTALDVATQTKGDQVVSGRNLINLTKAAATFPGEAAQLSGQVTARGQTAGDRIASHFDEALSDNPFYQTLGNADAQGKLAGPHYDAFYKANPSMASPLIDNILARPAGRQALKNVAEDMQNEATRMANPDPELTQQARDAGLYVPGGAAPGLKAETLDRVKQQIDQQAASAKRAMDMGTDRNARRDYYALSNMSSDLRNEMDRLDATAAAGPNSLKVAGGEYKQARALSAQKFQMIDAAEQGRNFMRQDPEEIQAWFGDENTSEPQKAAYLDGMKRATVDMADNKQVGANPIAAFNTPKFQKRIQAALGDDAQPLLDKLQMEAQMHRTNQVHMGGSDTATKLGFRRGLTSQSPGIVQRGVNLIRNTPDALIGEGINFADQALQSRAEKMDQATAAEVMRYMTTDDPGLWRGLAKKQDIPHITVNPRPGYYGEGQKRGGRIGNYARGGAVWPLEYPALRRKK